jgi:tetratricopeptide (TPR) repeat protein
LSSGLDFERYIGRHIWGLFVHGTRPSFYLYGPPSRWAPRASLSQSAPSSVLRHEMTHQLAAAVFGRTPRWFSEGLAQFLETVQITSDGNSIVVGRTNNDGRAKYYADRTVTLARTLDWTESIADLPESEVNGLYGTSWAFFYWLYNNQPESFSRYQIALAKGVHPRQAWASAFPQFSLTAHDPILYEYLRYGRGAVDTLPLRMTATKIAVKPLSAGDGHAIRARFALVGASGRKKDEAKGRREEAQAELKKAFTLDPTSVEALLLTVPTEALSDVARAAAKVHADDSRIHTLLGDLLDDREEREAAYRRALKIDHDDPQALDGLAKLLLASHRVDEAFPLALRATQRAPHDHDVLETFAKALLERGRCLDALQQQLRAAELARESESAAAAVVGRLDEMKASCRKAGALPPNVDLDAWIEAQQGPKIRDRAPPAADPMPAIRPHHEGLFVGATVGLGYGTGSYESSKLTALDSSFEGGSLDIAAAVGYGIFPGIVLAFEGGLFAHPAFPNQVNFNSGAFVTDVTTMRFGVLSDLHPSDESPMHLQLGIDFVRGSWSGSTGQPYSGFPDLPIDDASIGYFAHASAGFAWRVHHYELGPSLRLHTARLGSESVSASLFGVTALIGFFL